jgi:outer membrane receptor for ferrienterochelin and colicin
MFCDHSADIFAQRLSHRTSVDRYLHFRYSFSKYLLVTHSIYPRFFIVPIIALLLMLSAQRQVVAATIQGTVVDSATSQGIIGATISIENTSYGGVTDKHGEFRIEYLPVGHYRLKIRSLGYNTFELPVSLDQSDRVVTVKAVMSVQPLNSSEIVVRARIDRESETSARLSERTAPSIVAILSAQAIARYPDASIAETAKRVPGLSITRVRGEAREAIVRGMEGRYNNTLIDGVKVPSPSTNTRSLQLDYLASDLLQRIEVTKSLTPDMEADAIGGSVNLLMRTAPDRFLLRTRIGTGYNSTLVGNDLVTFRTDSVLPDPLETHGSGYQVKPSDFPRDNLKLVRRQALPDLIGEFTLGDRLLDAHLGYIVSGSLQRTSQHSESIRNYDAVDADNNLVLVRRQYRLHGHEKSRWGANAKLDYIFDDHHDAQLSFTGFMRQNLETRIINDTNLVYSPVLYQGSRSVSQTHLLTGIVLSGRDNLGTVEIEWRGGWSDARQTKPDRAEFTTSSALVGDSVASAPVFYSMLRDWQHNNDRDIFGGLDAAWKGLSDLGVTIKAGAQYRIKDRENYQNEYHLVPVTDSLDRVPYFTSIDEQQWEVKNTGGTPEYASNNYTAREEVTAAYLLGTWKSGGWNVLAGARLESTVARYATNDANRLANISAEKRYADILPSLHIRYAIDEQANLRLSLGQSISRPSYFDLVPYNYIGEEVREMGNPQLKRTLATNIDLKYETFPDVDRRFSIGAFYKLISNPVEYVLDLHDPALPTITPRNLGDATNFGVEVIAGIDLPKYFNLQGNYTYTHSTITTDKLVNDRIAGKVLIVQETRPLQGQSMHVGNIALGFNQAEWGTFAQLSFSFTGKRIAQVSVYRGYDHYESDYLLLDFSFQQHLSGNLSLFLRLNNLLNTMYQVRVANGPVVEQEAFGRTATVGFNYNY